MSHIFISYSRKDKDSVQKIVPHLKKFRRRDTIWYDAEIHGGAKWWQMILKQISNCDLFVYLISNDALTSKYCQAECKEAIRLQKNILPVIIRQKTHYLGISVPSDVRNVLNRTQYIDLSNGVDDTENFINFLNSVDILLENPQTKAPLSPELTSEPSVEDKPQVSSSNNSNEWRENAQQIILGGYSTILSSFTSLLQANELDAGQTSYSLQNLLNSKRNDKTNWIYGFIVAMISLTIIIGLFLTFPKNGDSGDIISIEVTVSFSIIRANGIPIWAAPEQNLEHPIIVYQGAELIAHAQQERNNQIWYLVGIPGRNDEYGWVLSNDVYTDDGNEDTLPYYDSLSDAKRLFPIAE